MKTGAQLDAAISWWRHAEKFDKPAFETACGVGVFVTGRPVEM